MTFNGKLEGKVAIITGGGAGFGVGIVEKFISEGAKVVVVDIIETNAIKVAEAQPLKRAIGLKANIASEVDWKNALHVAVTEFGRVDVVVNNAGVTYLAGPSTETPEKDFDNVMNVNVKGLYWSTKTLIPYFRKNSIAGIFINISSASSIRPRPNLVWYGASKAAITNATKGLALEWASHNIRFNVIHPVAGDTNMVPFYLAGDTPEARAKMLSTIPLGRMATKEDIGNAAAFLASEDASMLTGASIDVDGGRCI